jgi:hypothetical protein
MAYRPLTLVDLAGYLSRQPDSKVRWKHVWESAGKRAELLLQEPPSTGDGRWDVLLGALAEHLAEKLDRSPPEWARYRVLATPWFRPRAVYADRGVHLGACRFRKHGVHLSVSDLDAG